MAIRVIRAGQPHLTRVVWLPRARVKVSRYSGPDFMVAIPEDLATQDDPGLVEAGKWTWLPA